MRLRAILVLAALMAAALPFGHAARAQPPMPSWCSVWYDGCNTCRRLASGAVACVRRACVRRGQAYCMRR